MPTATATVNGTVLAKTDSFETVEGNIYFPPSSLDRKYFVETDTHTVCGWKGTASYYTVNVDGNEIKDAAWYYPEAKDKAKNIESYVAFYKNKVDVKSD